MEKDKLTQLTKSELIDLIEKLLNDIRTLRRSLSDKAIEVEVGTVIQEIKDRRRKG